MSCLNTIDLFWGLGIGDWGLGQSPIPNPQSPIPKYSVNNINSINIINRYFYKQNI